MIDELRVNMLIKNDFIDSKEIFIDIINQKTYIENYKTSIIIIVRQREQYVRKKIQILLITIIPFHNEGFMLIKTLTFFLSDDRDYIFEFINQVNLILFAYMINNKIIEILAKNDSDH